VILLCCSAAVVTTRHWRSQHCSTKH